MRRSLSIAALGLWLVVTLVAVTGAQSKLTPTALREHPAIAYARTSTDDAVKRLGERIADGSVTLSYNDRNGYLESLLAALDITTDSQLLVFSKTSFQAPKINPANPRGLYFNDHVAVGWVRGGDVLEFIAQDPKQGAIFYTFPQSEAAPKTFTRNSACVQCHTQEGTFDIPGMFAASVFPDSKGETQYTLLPSTDHRTPFDLRWGGWYVTGTHRGERHLGNATVSDDRNVEGMVSPATVHTTSLEGRVDLHGFPEKGSDLVALLVLEHQMRGLNLMTRLGWESRIGEATAGRPIDVLVNELVDYLLFVDEAELPGPIAGTSTFMQSFPKAGPRDGAGRSLRDFNLQTRLFEHACSFLVYSEPFKQLPDDVRQRIFARMDTILSGRDPAKHYAFLTPQRRQAAREILAGTGVWPTDKPDVENEPRASARGMHNAQFEISNVSEQ